MNFKFVMLTFCIVMLSGCIQTRRDIESAEEQEQKLNQIQMEKVSLENQVTDLQTDLRNILGRIEDLEQQKKEASEAESTEEQQLSLNNEERMKAYEETIELLEGQVKQLQLEMAALKQMTLNSATTKKVSKPAMGPYTKAEMAYKAKDWQKAITSFQDYREKYPKGRKYKDATYKIGVCFHELGMLTEAKAFYDEVIVRYPKSSEARKARKRIKSL